MPRRCTVCSHPDRHEIDAAVLSGEPYRRIAARFGVSPSSLRRHADAHVPSHLAEAREAREVVAADRLLADLDALRQDAADVYRRANAAESYSAAVAAVREQARIVETLLKVAGELAEGTQISVTLSPQWLQIRTAILRALTPYPEALAAVREALSDR